MSILSWQHWAKVKLTIPTDLFLSPDFIVQFLEQQVCTLNWDVGFVIQTMNEIGVPLPRLLEVYDHLFKSRVRKILNKIIYKHIHGLPPGQAG